MLEQARQLAAFLDEKPWVAFLSLTIIALVSMVVWLRASQKALIAEKDAHTLTAKEGATLASAMEHTWREQLQQNAKAQELQTRTLQVLDRAVTLSEGRQGAVVR